MRIGNQTIFVGDTSRDQRHGINGAEKKQNRSTIFAGGLKGALDPIAQKKKEAREQALKIVGDARKGDKKIDDDLEERRNRISRMKEEMGKAQTELNEISKMREDLQKENGLTEEDEEQKQLRLLEKELDSQKKGSGIRLTAEEEEQIASIKEAGLTEYQEMSLDLKKSGEIYRKQIDEAQEVIREESAVIKGTKLERLKTHVMVDAQKEADTVMEAASQEIIGMLMDEAKEHIDEEMEEKKEAAKDKAEEEKEQEEKLEKTKEEKEKKEEFTEEISESTEQMTELEGIKTDVQDEVQKILDKMKLLEEDIKGAAVDAVR